MNNKYMPDDKVTYVGTKFGRELAGGQGWVISEVRNNPDRYVVEFGSDSYIIHGSLLIPARATPAKDGKNQNEVHGVEIRHNRRRASEEDN